MLIKMAVSASLLLVMIFVLAGCSVISNCEDYALVENFTEMNSKEIISMCFSVKTVEIYSNNVEAGRVVFQYPYAGKELSAGSEVLLYTSKGMPPDGLDIQGMEADEADKMLLGNGVSFNKEYAFSVDVEKDYVIGLEEKAGAYTVHISKGKPELLTSGQPGYAVKAGGYIFYTDNEYIYKMNPDGTNRERIIDINEIQEIIPYEEWLVYLDVQNQILKCYNYVEKKEIELAKKVQRAYAVVDGFVIYNTEAGLMKASLESSNVLLLEPSEVRSVLVLDDRIIYDRVNGQEGKEYQSDLVSSDFFTGRTSVLLSKSDYIYQIIKDDRDLYYLTSKGIYYFDLEEMSKERVSDVTDGIDYIYNSQILYRTGAGQNDLIVMYDIKTRNIFDVCKYYCLSGLDKNNDWYYYIDGNAQTNKTYRIKSDGSVREFFCEGWITSGPYDELCFIDGWIYYLNEEHLLCRINIESKKREQIAHQPTKTPWWARI